MKKKLNQSFLITSLSVLILLLMVLLGTLVFLETRRSANFQEYEISLGQDLLTWGSFDFYSHIDSTPQVTVEYLLPKNFNRAATPIVFYAPFGNAKNALTRPQLYQFAAAKSMLIFTVAFNYDQQRSLPEEQQRTAAESGWFEKIIEIQRIIEEKFALPHSKLFVFGDSAGAVMSQQMSVFLPEDIEAAAWLSASGVKPYSSIKHPPVLAMSTWGDYGWAATKKLVDNERRQGGYALFMTTPPSWAEKGFSCFHHGAHDIGYNMILEFFAGIAEQRQNNTPNPQLWPEKITDVNGTLPVPSAAFKELWFSYPHDAIRQHLSSRENSDKQLQTLSPAVADKIIFYTHPMAWDKELWPTDIMYFLFEHNKYPIVAPPQNSLLNNTWLTEKLNELFTLNGLPDLPITIIIGGDCAQQLPEALMQISPENRQRLNRIVLLNPPVEEVENLLSIPKIEIWSNDKKFSREVRENIFYRSEEGESFGHFYFNVLGDVIDVKP